MSPDLDFQRIGQSTVPRGIREGCSEECLEGVEAADLALGKPCLLPLSTSATVARALKALKYNKDTDSLSVWVDTSSEPGSIAQSGHTKNVEIAKDRYFCGGVVTTLDIILFLAREESLVNPKRALKTHLKVFFPSLSQAVQHVHPRTSLCQALHTMLHGVQHLVVPITSSHHRQEGNKLNVLKPPLLSDLPAGDFCWISQEDVVRHLLSSCVGRFYPLPMMSLETLGIINTNVMVVDADSPAIRAAPLLQRASKEMSAVAVVTSRYSRGMWARRRSKKRSEGNEPAKLVGEISTQSLSGCKEPATAAAALATLSVREFLRFIQDDAASDPSHDLVQKVFSKLTPHVFHKTKCVCSRSCPALSVDSSSLRQSSLTSGISRHDIPDLSCDSSEDSSEDSSDEEEEEELPSVDHELGQSGASRTRADKLHTCTPQSSLVAVMAQALAHRVNHIWVTDRDDGLVGIVTYGDIIRILLSRLHSLKSASSFHVL